MTKEQFKNQNVVWEDKYYNYAIHITDGGAMYLYQVDGALTQTSLDNMSIIRLDGVDTDKLLENINKAKNQRHFECR